jgi:hypothetical protein
MSLESRTLNRWMVLALAVALVQTGCMTVPTAPSGRTQTSYLTPAEQRLRQQSAQMDAKSSLQGCLAGAVAGALIGMLPKGDRRDNVLIGAAAGCAVGLAANAYVQSKRQQYYNDEQRIAAMTADVRADNERVAALIDTSREVIAADRHRLEQVDNAYRRRVISADQARRELASVRANRDQLQSTVNSLKTKQGDWVEIATLEHQAGANTAPLDREIRALEQRISGLEQEVALMDRQINASPVAG